MDCFSGRSVVPPAVRYGVGLDRRLDGHLGHRLQRGRLQLALVDGLDGVIAAVEADDDDAGLAWRRSTAAWAPSAIVSLPAMMPLTSGYCWSSASVTVKPSVLAPVGGLLGDHLHVGDGVEDVVVALRPDVGVGVGVLAGQLDVGARLAHQRGELLGQDRGALVVVGDDLRDGHAFLRDLAVDEEAGDAGILGLLDGRHGGVRAGVVEDDRLGAIGDAGLEQLELLVGVVVMDQAGGACSRAPRPCRRRSVCMAPKNGFSTGGTMTQIMPLSCAAAPPWPATAIWAAATTAVLSVSTAMAPAIGPALLRPSLLVSPVLLRSVAPAVDGGLAYGPQVGPPFTCRSHDCRRWGAVVG